MKKPLITTSLLTLTLLTAMPMPVAAGNNLKNFIDSQKQESMEVCDKNGNCHKKKVKKKNKKNKNKNKKNQNKKKVKNSKNRKKKSNKNKKK